MSQVLDPQLRPVEQPAVPEPPRQPTESAQDRQARRRRRRRLLAWSAPVLLVVALVAAKLLVMVVSGAQAQAAYDRGDAGAVRSAGERMVWVNVIEQWKAPFTMGDAAVLAGDDAMARDWFTEALDRAPQDDGVSCRIRTNLVMTWNRMGDSAKEAGNVDEARADWQQTIALVAQAPTGCFQDPNAQAGNQLRSQAADAQRKLDDLDKQQDPSTQQQQQQQQQQDQQKLGQLDQKNQQDQQNRQQQQQQQQGAGGGSGNGGAPGGTSPTPYAKPW